MSNGSVGRGGGVYETQGRGSAVQTDGTSSAYPVLNPIAAASSNKSMPLIFFYLYLLTYSISEMVTFHYGATFLPTMSRLNPRMIAERFIALRTLS